MLVLALVASVVYAASSGNIISGDEIQHAYDFVVVGGGLAGLVLGGRLSEDAANYSVLVLEAGGNGDQYREQIGMCYCLLKQAWKHRH